MTKRIDKSHRWRSWKSYLYKMSFTYVNCTLIKKKMKFSSYIRKPFLLYDFALGCLRHFAYSKFRIFRMFFWVSYAIRKWPQFREIIRNFSCHFSMQIYTKFWVFREILWLFIPIFQRFITDDIFYTQQPSSSLSCILALHNRISLGHLPAIWGSNPSFFYD